MLARLYIVWDLLEEDVFAGESLRAEGGQFTINHFLPLVRRKAGEDLACEDVAAIFGLIAKDAVVKEVIGDAILNAKQW